MLAAVEKITGGVSFRTGIIRTPQKEETTGSRRRARRTAPAIHSALPRFGPTNCKKHRDNVLNINSLAERIAKANAPADY
jgi:hypothetical protein